MRADAGALNLHAKSEPLANLLMKAQWQPSISTPAILTADGADSVGCHSAQEPPTNLFGFGSASIALAFCSSSGVLMAPADFRVTEVLSAILEMVAKALGLPELVDFRFRGSREDSSPCRNDICADLRRKKAVLDGHETAASGLCALSRAKNSPSAGMSI
jgi:hypothetical protein